jgi:serine/threonine-protein kinase
VASPEPIPSPAERNPEVPEGLAQVALKALAREPDARYQTAEQLRTGLEDWLRVQPNNPGSNELTAFMHQLFSERIDKTARLIESARAGVVEVESTVSKANFTPSGVSMPGRGSAVVAGGPPRSGRWVIGAVGIGVALLGVAAVALRSEPAKVADVPLAAAASLSIETDPPGAALIIDGQPVGNAPATIEPIKVGAHNVRAVVPNFQPGERVIEIHKAGEHSSLLLTLKPVAQTIVVQATPADPVKVETSAGPSLAKGKLTLSTTPWSQVYEGNRLLGETPLAEVTLSAGKHTLKLKNDEKGLTKLITVEIKPGKTTLLREKL